MVPAREPQAKAHDAGAEQKAKIETAVAALKVQQTAYQEQMKKVRDASEAALADLRRGSERIAEELAKACAQAFGRSATDLPPWGALIQVSGARDLGAKS